MTVKAHRKPIKKLLQYSLLAAALSTLSSPASALSLSEIQLNSGLHQPFSASILLRNFDPIEADRISVEIANELIQTQYNNSNYLPVPLTATLKTTAKGTYIVLTSPTAIDEPFMKFAVQLNSPDGLILRQYEVLIDPPKNLYSPTPKMVKQQLAARPQKPTPAAVEKLKAAIKVSKAQQAQGIELAPPETAALQKAPTPQVRFNAQPYVKHLGAAPMLRNALAAPAPRPAVAAVREEQPPQVAALVRSPAEKTDNKEKLFNVQTMNTDEFLEALDEYSFANIYGAQKKTAEPEEPLNKPEVVKASTIESSSIDPTISMPIPEVAALSRAPDMAVPVAQTPEAVSKKIDSAIPAAVVIGQKTARFSVDDEAFAGYDADAVARALMDYREQARAGKKPSFNPHDLMKMSASGVNRLSNTTE